MRENNTSRDRSPWAMRLPLAAACALLPTVLLLLLISPFTVGAQETVRSDTANGSLTQFGRSPVAVRYVFERADSTVSLELEISDETFHTTDLRMGPDSLEFDWVPGDESVHCTLVRDDDNYKGDCVSGSGGSFTLTVEAFDRHTGTSKPTEGAAPPPRRPSLR